MAVHCWVVYKRGFPWPTAGTLYRWKSHNTKNLDFAPLYILLVVLVAVAQSMLFWVDNRITESLLQFWWLGVIAAYLLTCFEIMLRDLDGRVRILLAVGSGLFVLASIYLFDDLYTFYFSAITLVVANLVAWHLESVQSPRHNRITRLVLTMLVIAVLFLPVSASRVEVKFPNLSGGTWVTFLSDNEYDQLPPESLASYFNILDYLWPFPITFGTRVYPLENQPSPRLRFDIERENIVLRLLSIRFKSHVGFLETTLSEISGMELEQLIALNEDAGYSLKMEGQALLISGLETGQPAMIQLPAPDTYEVPAEKTAMIVMVRLLLLAAIWFCSPAWLPRTHTAGGNANRGTPL